MHDTALRVLEELGLRVLLDEGRAIFRAGGALVDEKRIAAGDKEAIQEAARAIL